MSFRPASSTRCVSPSPTEIIVAAAVARGVSRGRSRARPWKEWRGGEPHQGSCECREIGSSATDSWECCRRRAMCLGGESLQVGKNPGLPGGAIACSPLAQAHKRDEMVPMAFQPIQWRPPPVLRCVPLVQCPPPSNPCFAGPPPAD